MRHQQVADPASTGTRGDAALVLVRNRLEIRTHVSFYNCLYQPNQVWIFIDA